MSAWRMSSNASLENNCATTIAVSAGAAAPDLDKLLPLPAFMRDADSLGDAAAWVAGLRLTGHFLERDAFGARHRPLPEARFRLAERIAALMGDAPDNA